MSLFYLKIMVDDWDGCPWMFSDLNSGSIQTQVLSMTDIHDVLEIIQRCDRVISSTPDIFYERFACPACSLSIPLTTRICEKCGMGIPDSMTSDNINDVIREDDEGDDTEDTEALLNIGTIERILQVGQELAIEDTILKDSQELKIPDSTDYIGAYRTRGIAYTNLGEFDRALNDFDEIIRFKIFSINKYQDYCDSKKNSCANKRLLQFLFYHCVCANLAFDYIRRGFVYSITRQYDKAFNDFEMALNLNYLLIYLSHGEKGLSYSSRTNEGQFDKIIDHYNLYIEANPNNACAYACRGFFLKYNHLNSNNIGGFVKAIEIDPDLNFAFYMRGRCYAAKSHYDEAIEDFSRAISINPGNANYFIARGRVYYTLQEFGKTIDDFKTALQIRPEFYPFSSKYVTSKYGGITSYAAWLNNLCDKKTRYLKRIEKLNKEILRKQGDASRYFKRGRAYSELGHFDPSHYQLALTDFNKVLLIERNNEHAYVWRGFTLIELQKYDAAIEDFSMALSLKSDYSFAYQGRSIAYYKKGDYEKVVSDFKKSGDKSIPILDRRALGYYRRALAES